MLTVAIAVEPPAEYAEGPRAISESCEEVIGRGRCVVAAELEPQRVVTWYAVVVIDEADASTWRIEFRDRSHNGVLIETRSLTFSSFDSRATRWASIGTIVAAMVTARDGDVQAPKLACKHCPATPVIAPASVPHARTSWGFDIAALTGPALDEGTYRFGALTRLHVTSSLVPGAVGLVGLRYTERPGENLELAWWSAAIGIGARIPSEIAQFGAELTGELVFERMLFRATSRTNAGSDSTARNRLGGRLGLNGIWAAWRPLALVVGAEASVLRPSVEVQVENELVGRAPLFGFGFSFGLRLMLD